MTHPPEPPGRGTSTRPEFVMSVWRSPAGHWQGRLKSVRDGSERDLSDLSDLLDTLDHWPSGAPWREPHAEA